jgi:hypothetical protein
MHFMPMHAAPTHNRSPQNPTTARLTTEAACRQSTATCKAAEMRLPTSQLHKPHALHRPTHSSPTARSNPAHPTRVSQYIHRMPESHTHAYIPYHMFTPACFSGYCARVHTSARTQCGTTHAGLTFCEDLHAAGMPTQALLGTLLSLSRQKDICKC